MKFKQSALEETLAATYNPEAFSAQLNKGVEHAVEGSKISMKVIAQQNEMVLNAITKSLSAFSQFNPFGFALGTPNFADYFAMQKEMLAKAMEQSTAVIEAMQQAGTKATSELSNMVQQSVATAQKNVVEINAPSTKSKS